MLIVSASVLEQVFEQTNGDTHSEVGVCTVAVALNKSPNCVRFGVDEVSDDDESLPATVVISIFRS
jgi:hypothetical protein